MAVDRHAGHRIPLHPPKRAAAYPTTTGIRHLTQVLTEPFSCANAGQWPSRDAQGPKVRRLLRRFRDALAPPTARPWLTPPDLGAGTGQKRSIFPEHLLNFLGVVRLR